MTARVVGNEFAKMRHLHVGASALVLFALMVLVALFTMVSDPGSVPGSAHAWNAVLTGITQGALIASPLLVAVAATRQVDIEHQGNGWLMTATAGATTGALGRAKFVALGVVVSAAVVLASATALALGVFLLGGDSTIPWGRWLLVTALVLVIDLVVLAVHIVLAIRIQSQLVGMGVGLLGLIFALIASGLPRWAAHLLPWGYYSLSMPAEYQGTDLVEVTPEYVGVVVLGVVVATLFVLVTGRFDRQEV